MKKIELTKGKYAIIDDRDFEKVSRYNWCFTNGYAMRNIWVNKKHKCIYMHRYILDAKKGEYVDHINHDSIDNRRSNLRIVSQSQNIMNSRNKSGNRYKGVHWSKNSKKWVAAITKNYKQIHIGYFDRKRDAAIAYNNMAIKIFGEYAFINKLKEVKHE